LALSEQAMLRSGQARYASASAMIRSTVLRIENQPVRILCGR
jgi:hypothetical protein